MGKEVEGIQENKRSQINFGYRGGGKGMERPFPLPPPLVCSVQAGVLDQFWEALDCEAPRRPGLLDQQTKLPHQISSHPHFPKCASCFVSGRFSFSLPVMFAVRCRQDFH